MSQRAYHMNLLMESEKLSSSPIRFRVMLPILAGLAAIGMTIWWLILFSQVMLTQANVTRFKDDMDKRDAAHKAAREQMAQIAEDNAQLAQLDCYSNSIVRRGELLTKLAEAMPIKVQLQRLEIPAPETPKIPEPPKPTGKKKKKVVAPVVLEPTNYVERASLVLAGRAPKEPPIITLMETLAGDAFTNVLVVTHDPRHPDPSPKVRSFRQDVAARGETGARMVAFEVEYKLPERRFDK